MDYLLGGGVGLFKFVFVFPKVVNAVELTPNNTMKTTNNIVRLPHCVNLFNGGVAILFVFYADVFDWQNEFALFYFIYFASVSVTLISTHM